MNARRAIGPLALFSVLAVIHTWPLASAPGTLSRNDNADTVLNQWAIAWVAHQLPRDPVRLFDANIFYPEQRTLAFSEHMIVQGLMGVPLFAAGASPVLAYNLLVLAGFALTAFSMYFVVLRWTGDRVAAITAGCLAAFNAHSFTRIPHLQALHVEFLPLAIYCLDRLLASPRVLTGLALGSFFALQGLTSYYWFVFAAFALVAAALARPMDWWGERARRLVVPAGAALGVALLIVVPFLWPYYDVSRSLGIVRSLDDVALYSGSWRDYLSTPGRLHFAAWSHVVWGTGGKTPLFPGVLALGLGAIAVAARWRDTRVRMWLAIVVVGVLLSFGTNLPGYGWLYQAVPMLKGIRAPVRAGHLALIALAALAGFGLAHLRHRIRRPGVAGVLAVTAIVIATAESWVAPIGYYPAREPAAVGGLLSGEPRAVVAVFPMASPSVPFGNAQYMLDSTLHWKPMLNGYSGFVPPSYVHHWTELQTFPDERALAYLERVGVTHVVVYHGDGEAPEHRGLQRVAGSDGVTVFRLRWERIEDPMRR